MSSLKTLKFGHDNSQPLNDDWFDLFDFDASGARGGPGGGGGGGGGTPLLTSYTSGDATVDDSQEFNIHVEFSGKWTAAQQADVIWAADAWSKIITGDIRDDLDLQGNLIDDISITFSVGRIDGSGSRLTGVNTLAQTSNLVVRDPGTEDQWLPLTASIKLDSTDLKDADLNGLWKFITMHEIGHALGFAAPIFQNLGLVDGAGNFTGSQAVAAYGGPAPLAPDGSHWIETSTATFSPNGTPLSTDLMTPLFTAHEQTALSDTTVATFGDLGYAVADLSPTSSYLDLSSNWMV
jgi:hypothetical protein